MLQDDRPRHKILCKRKYYRYVVACMHNCVEPHFCREFWTFFKAIGRTPAEYYNEGGIGDAIMRRVVFDCDRCGKRDLADIYGLYDRNGEEEENLLGDEARLELINRVGYKDPLVETLTFATLRSLEDGLGWVHYCRRCFMTVSDNLAKVANLKKPVKPPKPKPKVAAPAPEPAAEVAPEPILDPADEPAPEAGPKTGKAGGKASGRKKSSGDLPLSKTSGK